jgi:hypothetical protein
VFYPELDVEKTDLHPHTHTHTHTHAHTRTHTHKAEGGVSHPELDVEKAKFIHAYKDHQTNHQ